MDAASLLKEMDEETRASFGTFCIVAKVNPKEVLEDVLRTADGPVQDFQAAFGAWLERNAPERIGSVSLAKAKELWQDIADAAESPAPGM